MPLKPAPVASVQRPIRESGARSRRADGCNGGRTCPTRRTSDFGRAMRARVALGRRLASGRGRLEQLLTPTVGTCSSPCAPSDSVQGPTSEGVVLGAPAWTSAVPVANASSARGRDRDDSEAAWASAASVRARAPASREGARDQLRWSHRDTDAERATDARSAAYGVRPPRGRPYLARGSRAPLSRM
jgi:hypothetical protein